MPCILINKYQLVRVKNYMNNFVKYLSITCLCALCACGSKKSSTILVQQGDTLKITEAEKFSIIKHANFTELNVFDPWQGATNIHYRYALLNQADSTFKRDGYDAVIQIPIKRVVCLSTTHVGFVAHLQQENSIVGISGSQLVNNATVLKGIAAGNVSDVGYESSLNYELIMKLKPDVVLAYGVGHDLGYIAKLREMGVPVIFLAEYLEKTPLGKAEWLKYVAALYGQTEVGVKLYNEIVQNYADLLLKVKNVTEKPRVLSGLPWNETWYVAGGQSSAAKALTDAGCEYVFSYLQSNEGIPMSIESVFQKAVQSTIWVNTGAALTKKDILTVDNRLASLPPFQKNEVYNCNARITQSGGNDYYESGIVRPDLILADLISIFHPNILPNRSLFYYRKLE
jgi:iron complex transport system substrate-binding protein